MRDFIIRFLQSYFQKSYSLSSSMLWRSLVLCLVGAACAFAANANPALKGTDRCGMPMPVRLLLSRYASSLGLCRPLLVQRRSRWRSAWDGSAGQAGQRFGRISSSIAASGPYVVASAAVVLCEAVFFACCPASLLFLFFAKANLFPLPSPFSVRNASAKHYRPRVRRWLRQRDNTCTRLQRARGTH